MKILKADNPVKEGEVKKKFNIKAIIEKIGKRNLIIIGSVLAVGIIVYVNWFLLEDNEPASSQPTEQAGQKADDYFTSSVLNRNRARDEAMEVLQAVVDAGSSEDASKSALADISRIAADIEKEANVESLVKSKGFSECVAVISGDNISIVVHSEALLPSDIAQIKEIAYENADILPENVVIIQK